AHCRPDVKVCFVEGGDGWNEIHDPLTPVDAVFRREALPHVSYPYAYHPITFAAPSRWFHPPPEADRHLDVVGLLAHPSHPIRWEAMRQAWNGAGRYNFLMATSNPFGHPHYLSLLRHAKIALCGPGGAASDCMRFAEVAACGAIPLFVGLPPKVRWNWFTD